MLTRLPAFNELHHENRENFMLELFMKMESSTTCEGDCRVCRALKCNAMGSSSGLQSYRV